MQPSEFSQTSAPYTLPSPPPPPLPIGGGGDGNRRVSDAATATSVRAQPAQARDVFRWAIRGVCPACGRAWRFDIDSPTDPAGEMPDPQRMPEGLLCGSCHARRRVLYRDDSGIYALWGPEDVSESRKAVNDDPDRFRPRSTRSRGPVPFDAPIPVDTIAEEKSWFRRISVLVPGVPMPNGISWSEYITRAKFLGRRPT